MLTPEMILHRAHGRRIRLLRDSCDWTQEQLASVAGYSIETIWKAEAGKPLRRKTLADIAQALGVELSDIVRAPHELTINRRDTGPGSRGP